MTTTPPVSLPPAPSPAPATAQRNTSSQSTPAAEQRDAFAQALHAKSSRREGREEKQQKDDSRQDGAESLFAAALGLLPPAPRPVESETRTAAGAVDTPTGARAAIEAALNANAGLEPPGLGDVNPASLWHASINESNGVALDVRVMRPEGANQWSASVSSSNVQADVLARHVPKLNERMRKHGVGFSHVRIEEHQDDEAGDDA